MTDDPVHAFRGHGSPESVEVLKAYSHFSDQLQDLRMALEAVRSATEPQADEGPLPDEQPPSLAERLTAEGVQTLIEQYHAGAFAKDLAAHHGVSTKTIQRLLKKHGARRCDKAAGGH